MVDINSIYQSVNNISNINKNFMLKIECDDYDQMQNIGGKLQENGLLVKYAPPASETKYIIVANNENAVNKLLY